MPPPDGPRDPWASWRPALALSAVGIALVGCIVAGTLLGMWLDDELGTKPWLMAAGLLLGAAAGFLEMALIVKRYVK